MTMSPGYDAISESSIQIISELDNKTGEVTINRGRGIVIIHKMKELFCDDCIKAVLETNKNVLVPEFIIYDAVTHSFYQIEDGEMYQIGDYTLKIQFADWNTYKMYLSYK